MMTRENKQGIQAESTDVQATVRRWQDKAKFIAAHSEYWQANEAENIAFIQLTPQSSMADSVCLSIHDTLGNSVQTAFLSPSEQIIISSAAEWATAALCKHLAHHKLHVPGIFAPTPTGHIAAKKLAKRTGKSYRLVKELLHLELRRAPKSRFVAGHFRVAESQDSNQLAAHRQALQAESNTQRPFDSALSVQTDLQSGALYTWIDNRQIVASGSLYQSQTPTSAYINHVYVEPKYRRRGYASALVHQLCERALAQGNRPCLSVDAENQAAYQAYLKIGFTLAARMGNFRMIIPLK